MYCGYLLDLQTTSSVIKGEQQKSSLIRAGEVRLESFIAPSGEVSLREKYGSSGFGPRESDTGRVLLRLVEMEG
jgi:hypothetical protein